MDNHSEHSGENSFGFSLSRGPSLAEKSHTTGDSRRKDEIKYTMAYEKGLMKERCNLCKMYFHRNSVNYKVPNHRILELERKWNVKREGRRYASAGYLYKMIEVCCFCSQFFKIMPDQIPEAPPKVPDEKPIKLEITTAVERTDIARGQRVYSSSDVDGRTAEMAILPPYEEICRTRREVDPWWEIDFSRSYHVHSLSFLISTGKHQQLNVSVFLLNHPYGFEDPFIDSIKGKAVASKTEIIPQHEVSTMVPITWTFDPNTTCFAIRIQLKGIHSLAVQRFQVLQGDDIIPTTDADLAVTLNSYASLSPVAVKAGALDLMSPEEKKIIIKENDPYIDVDERLKEKYMTVGTLAQQIKRRKNKLRQWKEKVQSYASIFPPEEIEGLYRVIFKPTLEAKPCLVDAPPLLESDLMGDALLQHYPRCDLGELQARLRSIVRWIQTRSHLKVLGPLASSHNFDIVANDPNSHLHRLSSALKQVESYWMRCEAKEALLMQNAKDLGFVGVKAAEARGCSWAQFLILISLFCTHKCRQIPDAAFYLDTIGTTSDVAHNTLHGQLVPTPDDISVGSNDGPQSLSGGGSLQSGTSNRSNGGGEAGIGGVSGRSGRSGKVLNMEGMSWLDRMATPVVHNPPVVEIEKKTFLQKAREKELFPYYNSSFAEYKFWHFQRRTILQNIDFPPDLSLEFARTLIPKRASTSHGGRNLPALDATAAGAGAGGAGGGSAANETASQTAEGKDETASVHSALSVGTDPNKVGSRPNTTAGARGTMFSAMGGTSTNLLGTPSRKFRPLPGTPSGGEGGALRTPSPSSKFKPGSASAKVMPSASTKQLMSASLSSLEGLVRGSSFVLNQGSLTRSSTSRELLGPAPGSRPQTTSALGNARSSVKMATANTTATNSRPTTSINDDADSFGGSDLISFGDSEKGEKNEKQTVTIDFFRVCTLCELKFPRDCMEMKVMRKHVVQLRMSWDPNLVSKEVRLLDHTISMYSLVHVCTFCSQFFDPDFPDGIAYPVRVASPVPKVKGVLDAIATQNVSAPLLPHYDTRFVAPPVAVGEVFRRPHSVEARSRAQRAREIDQRHKERQAAILEASLKAK